jgi:large subunit ribosomal protein L7e
MHPAPRIRLDGIAVANNARSVPTQNDIAVPETILKKQKANQKVNDQRAADLQKKREVL